MENKTFLALLNIKNGQCTSLGQRKCIKCSCKTNLDCFWKASWKKNVIATKVQNMTSLIHIHLKKGQRFFTIQALLCVSHAQQQLYGAHSHQMPSVVSLGFSSDINQGRWSISLKITPALHLSVWFREFSEQNRSERCCGRRAPRGSLVFRPEMTDCRWGARGATSSSASFLTDLFLIIWSQSKKKISTLLRPLSHFFMLHCLDVF